MIFSGKYINFKKRWLDLIKIRLILFTIAPLILVKTNPGVHFSLFIAISVSVIFNTVIIINSFSLNKYYLVSIDFDEETKIIKLIINKYDELYKIEEIPMKDFKKELRQVPNSITFLDQLVFKKGFTEVYSQPSTGFWQKSELKKVYDFFSKACTAL